MQSVEHKLDTIVRLTRWTSLPRLDCCISLTVFFLLSCFRYSDDVEPQKMLCLGKRNPKSNGFCAVVKHGWPRLLMNVLTSFQCFSVAFVIFGKKIIILRVLQYRRKWKLFWFILFFYFVLYLVFKWCKYHKTLEHIFFLTSLFFLLLHCDTCQ